MKTKTYRHGRLYGRITRALAMVGCASLLGTAGLQAQTYQYTYGLTTTNESAALHPIEVTADGGTISVGTTQNAAGNRDIYLIKTNNLGVLQWSFAYGNSTSGSHEDGFDVLEETDQLGNTSGYVVVGRITDANGSDVYMMKTDQNGNFLWGKRYPDLTSGYNGVGRAIIKNSSQYLITGTRHNPAVAGSSDVLFLKTDLNGVNARLMHVGVPNLDDGGYALAMSGGTAVIVGFTMNGASTDGLVLGLDPATGGLSGFPRRYGNSSNNDTLFTIEALGSHLLTAGTVHYSNGAKDIWGLVLNSGGWGPVWGHAYSAYVSGPSVNRINLGAEMRLIGTSYTLVGTTAYNADNPPTTYTRQIILMRLNNGTGVPVASKVYGTSTQYGKASQAYGLRQSQAVYPLIGGQQNYYPISTPSTGLFDAYLIRPATNLSSFNCFEQNPEVYNTLYTTNAYIDVVASDFPTVVPSDNGSKLTFSVGSVTLCYCSFCKTTMEPADASSGELSLDVHGDAATGEVHVEAAGIQEGTSIDIFDAGGRMVRSLEIASGSGTGTIVWDGADNSGNRLPNGLYFVRAQGATSVITRPAQLVR